MDAFEEFYKLGATASDKKISEVASKSHVTERTIWRWYKAFGWKERAHLRDIEIKDQVNKKVIDSISDSKAKYLTFVNKLFNDLKERFENGDLPIEIKSVSDLDKATKLGLLLQGESTDINETRHKIEDESMIPVDPRDRARGRDFIQSIRPGQMESRDICDGDKQR